jgi:hypothetical protein
MDLTLLRQETRTTSYDGITVRRSVFSRVTGPAGVLVASCALAGVFLAAVADLVSRLG